MSYAYFQLHDQLDDDGYPRDYIVTTLIVKLYYFNSSVSAADAIASAASNPGQARESWLVKPYYKNPEGFELSSFNENREFKLAIPPDTRVVVECFIVNGFDPYGDERYTRKRISFIHQATTRHPLYLFETDEYLANVEDNHYLASILFMRQKCDSYEYESIPARDQSFTWSFNGEQRTGGLLLKYILPDLSEIEIHANNDYQYSQFRRNHFADFHYRDTAIITRQHCR